MFGHISLRERCRAFIQEESDSEEVGQAFPSLGIDGEHRLDRYRAIEELVRTVTLRGDADHMPEWVSGLFSINCSPGGHGCDCRNCFRSSAPHP